MGFFFLSFFFFFSFGAFPYDLEITQVKKDFLPFEVINGFSSHFTPKNTAFNLTLDSHLTKPVLSDTRALAII